MCVRWTYRAWSGATSSLDAARTLVVVAQHEGRPEVAVLFRQADAPDVGVSLTHDQAIALAALLTGARFSIEARQDEEVAGDHVSVRALVQRLRT